MATANTSNRNYLLLTRSLPRTTRNAGNNNRKKAAIAKQKYARNGSHAAHSEHIIEPF